MHTIVADAANRPHRTLERGSRAPSRAGTDRFTGWKDYWKEHRWTQPDWIDWQTRGVPLPRSFKHKVRIVGRLLGLESSMYTKLNGGDKQPSERVQHIAMLAEIAAAVAQGDTITARMRSQAALLLRDRHAILTVIAHKVETGQYLTEDDRDLAADAILLDETDRAIEEEEADLNACPRFGRR